MYTDQVSIIIPYTRAELVETLLSKLMQQSYPPQLTEIILVGQNSASLASHWPIKAIETTSTLLPGEGRNTGARIACYLLMMTVNQQLIGSNKMSVNCKRVMSELSADRLQANHKHSLPNVSTSAVLHFVRLTSKWRHKSVQQVWE